MIIHGCILTMFNKMNIAYLIMFINESYLIQDIIRSSHRRCFTKKGVLRNFAKFAGKHLCQSLFFNEVASLRLATILKKRLWYKCFPENFAKFLRTPFLQNTFGRLLLYYHQYELSFSWNHRLADVAKLRRLKIIHFVQW